MEWYSTRITGPADLADWILVLRERLEQCPDEWENWTPDSYIWGMGSCMEDNPPGKFFWVGPADPGGPTWEIFAEYLLEAVKTYRPDAPQPELRGPLTAVRNGSDFIQFLIDISELEDDSQPVSEQVDPQLSWARLSGQPPSASAHLKLFLTRLSEVVRSSPPLPNERTAGRRFDQPSWRNIQNLLCAGASYE